MKLNEQNLYGKASQNEQVFAALNLEVCLAVTGVMRSIYAVRICTIM